MEILTWISLASLTRLTPEENNDLKGNCGLPLLSAFGEDSRKKRNYPGTKETGVYPDPARRVPIVFGYYGDSISFPFAAEVFRDGEFKCSGVLISQRHVITAASCVLYSRRSPDRKRIAALEPYTNITLTFANSFVQESFMGIMRMYKTKYILPHPLYLGQESYFNIAVIELVENVDRNNARPICLPKQWDPLDLNMTLIGFGRYAERTGTEDVMRTMELTLNVSATDMQRGLIVTHGIGKKICWGDQGGPLFKIYQTKAYLLGVASDSTEVRNAVLVEGRDYASRFVDVRSELPWICALTGVCTETNDTDSKTAEYKRFRYTVGYKFGQTFYLNHPPILARRYRTNNGTRHGVRCPRGWNGTICVSKAAWHIP